MRWTLNALSAAGIFVLSSKNRRRKLGLSVLIQNQNGVLKNPERLPDRSFQKAHAENMTVSASVFLHTAVARNYVPAEAAGLNTSKVCAMGVGWSCACFYTHVLRSFSLSSSLHKRQGQAAWGDHLCQLTVK